MNWSEVTAIINERMSRDERSEIARIDVKSENSIWITEKAIKLVKDTFGVWTFVIGGADDDTSVKERVTHGSQ